MNLDYTLCCHPSGTLCASVSPITGNLIASAGRDKDVSIWVYGEMEPKNTLATKFNPESLTFGHVDDKLLAIGSPAGSIKIVDLNMLNETVSLSGHGGPVRCITQATQVRWASGSVDCSVRIWDTRTKASIMVLRDHSKTVNSVSCSPDGNLIISTSDDCTVKIWDHRNTRVLKTIKEHSAPVLSAVTHPIEFLMATGSADKTVRFWDLETYECVSQSDTAAGAVQSIMFHTMGDCLMAVGESSLRFLGWEPARTFNNLMCDGPILAHGFQPQKDRHICLTTDDDKTGLHIFSVAIQSLRPFSPQNEELTTIGEVLDEVHIDASQQSPLHKPKNRRSFADPKMQLVVGDSTSESSISSSTETSPVHEISPTPNPVRVKSGLTKPSPVHKKRPLMKSNSRERRTEAKKHVEMNVPPEIVFESRPKLTRSPPPQISLDPQFSALTNTSVLPQRSDDPFGKTYTVVQVDTTVLPSAPPIFGKKTTASPVLLRKNSVPNPKHNNSEMSRESSLDESKISNKFDSAKSPPWKGKGKVAKVQPQRVTPTPSLHSTTRVLPSNQCYPMFSGTNNLTVNNPQNSADICSPRTQDFLPPSSSIPVNCAGPEECFNAVDKNANNVRSILNQRLKSLNLMHKIWRERGAKDAVRAAMTSNDQSIVAEVVKLINQRGNGWTLDLAHLLLPQIRIMFERHAIVAAQSVQSILRNTGQLLRDGVRGTPSIGVDVSMEERSQKCLRCVTELKNIHCQLNERPILDYQEVNMQLDQFFQ